MTGPEHYREAERLLIEASELLVDPQRASMAGRDGWREDIAHYLNARAQVHATLALAAATAMADVMHEPDREEWERVAGCPVLMGEPPQ